MAKQNQRGKSSMKQRSLEYICTMPELEPQILENYFKPSESKTEDTLLKDELQFCPPKPKTDLLRFSSSYFERMDSPWNLYNATQKLPSYFSSFAVAKGQEMHVGTVDFIADAESMKELLRIPFSSHSASLILHRVGNSLLMDHFEIPQLHYDSSVSPMTDYKSDNGSWEWFNEFVKLIVGTKTMNDIRFEDKTQATIKNKSTLHNILQCGLLGPPSFKTEPSIKKPEAGHVVPAPSHNLEGSNKHFLRKVLWQFFGHQMLIGTQTPVVEIKNSREEGSGDSLRNNIRLATVRTNDSKKCKKISTEDGFDMWLDNLMLGVPETLIMHQENYYVEQSEFINTEEIPTWSGFEMKKVQERCSPLLTLIKESTSTMGHSYWLYRAPDSKHFKIYDLSRIVEEVKCAEMNPWAPAIGCLLYSVCQVASDIMLPNTVLSMMRHFLDIFPETDYPLFAAGAVYHVLNSRLPDSMDARDGLIRFGPGICKPKIGFVYNYPREINFNLEKRPQELENYDIFSLQYYNEPCFDDYFEKLLAFEKKIDWEEWFCLRRNNDEEKRDIKNKMNSDLELHFLNLKDLITTKLLYTKTPADDLAFLCQPFGNKKSNTNHNTLAKVSAFSMDKDVISCKKSKNETLEGTLSELYVWSCRKSMERTATLVVRNVMPLQKIEQNSNDAPFSKVSRKAKKEQLRAELRSIENIVAEIDAPVTRESRHKVENLPLSSKALFLKILMEWQKRKPNLLQCAKTGMKNGNSKGESIGKLHKNPKISITVGSNLKRMPSWLQHVFKDEDSDTNLQKPKYLNDDYGTTYSWIFTLTAKLLIRQLLTGLLLLELTNMEVPKETKKSRSKDVRIHGTKEEHKTLCQLMHNKMALLMFSLAHYGLQQTPRRIMLTQFCAKEALFHNREGSLQRKDIQSFSWYLAGLAHSYLIPVYLDHDQLLKNHGSFDSLLREQEPHLFHLVERFRNITEYRDSSTSPVSKDLMLEPKHTARVQSPTAITLGYFKNACDVPLPNRYLEDFMKRVIAQRIGKVGYEFFILMQKCVRPPFFIHAPDGRRVWRPKNLPTKDDLLEVQGYFEMAARNWEHDFQENHVKRMQSYAAEVQIFEYLQDYDPFLYSSRADYYKIHRHGLGMKDNTMVLRFTNELFHTNDAVKFFNKMFPEREF